MSAETSTIDPVLTNDERDELRHLDYLSDRIRALRDRGAITEESFAAIDADRCRRREEIERRGRYQALMSRSLSLSRARPADALHWAQEARALDPSRPDAWVAAVDLLWKLERDDEAVALCDEAAGRLPELAARHEALHSQLGARAQERQAREERTTRLQEFARSLAAANRALVANREDEAVELAREVLDIDPMHPEALQMAGFALQRLGRLDESIACYGSLARLQPSNPNWSAWVRNLETRRRFEKMLGDGAPGREGDGVAAATPPDPNAPPPHWSWSSFAAEFLEEHWQKLILCLAVLLIVVSSTVGAHLLLGELLWQPAGKCALAMVWTILFAALGRGLIGWGAERAGRMMLVATLIVVPIHFMLAGEFKLVTEPTPFGMAVATIDGLALVGLVRVVAGMLVPAGPARFLSASLLLLSVGSAFTSRGSPVGWGWQFAAFQAPGVVLLGSVWALGRRRWGASDEDHRDFATMVLGLLGFAFLATTIRIGGYAMGLDPPLYAVPVMLGAIATVGASRRLAPFEPDARRIAGIRYAGYVLSALAFALALTVPPWTSALLSGNSVAACLLGLLLYAASLRRERHPAFLYLSIGALVAARVGAHYFLADRIQVVIDALRRLLGYEDALPVAYLALLGLIASPALAALSAWFRRGWDDERLARHCHYIGLPLAIAACLWGAQESLAATIVLSVYTLYFSLAVWLYAAPLLSYAAILALCGASYFAMDLLPATTYAGLALAAAALAWLSFGVDRLLRWTGTDEEFAIPWTRASRALAAVGFLIATGAIALDGAESSAAASAFALVGGLALIASVERPRQLNVGTVLLCFVELTICGLALVAHGRTLGQGSYALLLACDGLILMGLARFLDGIAATDDTRRAAVFRDTIDRFVIALALIADVVAFERPEGSWVRSVVWLLGAPVFLGTTRQIREIVLVYLGLVHFVVGVLALGERAMAFHQMGMTLAWLALVGAGLAFMLWLAGVVLRRRGFPDFYVRPCFHVGLTLTAIVLAWATGARLMLRDAYRYAVAALAINATATLLLADAMRRFRLTYAAILHVVVATYLVLFSVGTNDPRMAYVLGLAAVVEGIVFWAIGFGCERLVPRLRPFSVPFYQATAAMAFLGIPLSDRSSMVFALAAVAFLLMVRGVPLVEWLYATAVCLASACYFRWLVGMSPGGLMAAAMAGALAFWMVAVAVSRSRASLCERLGLRPLPYEYPLFHSSIVLVAIALAIRGSLSLAQRGPWTSFAWLPAWVSLMSILMVRPYPRREWVHASLAFLVYAVASIASPSLTAFGALALAGMITATVLLVLEQSLRFPMPTICQRLGVADAGYLGVVRAWALGLFGVVAALMVVVVLRGMAGAFDPTSWVTSAIAPADWWMLLVALGVAAIFLMMAFSDPEGWGSAGSEGILNLLHAVLVLGLWWLAASGSPIARWLPAAGDYYPIVTAIAALRAIDLGRRFTAPGTWHEPVWLGDARSEIARAALGVQACALAIVAITFTGLHVAATTVATMVLASLTLGLAASQVGWAMAAGLSGIAWAGAWAVLGSLAARWLGFAAGDQRETWAAWGALVAAFTLWRFAGWFRHGGTGGKGGPAPAVLRRFGTVLEGVGSGTALLASGLVLLIAFEGQPSALWVTYAGVVAMLAAALLHVLLTPRWRSEGPIYVAQALMVGAYVRFRLTFPLSSAADAAVLTALAYLDMGIAEAVERLDRQNHYTRPTRYTSLVLPLLPLLSLLASPRWDDVSLFYLAAASAFYATACATLRWKTLGYAAAVFADAALWLTWSRIGWELVDYPQLYLVPVGLSAILFAEVNRELGRPAVNAIRTVGLIVIYASLAMPIWRFASFGAWATLLFASLLGVFAGIGLRLQTFLWLGLTTFVLDVVYELGRVSLDHAMAKWAIMLGLGIALVLFVALNEKKRILSQMMNLYAHVRTWD